MNCPKCGGKTYIIDSRPDEETHPAIKRRRMCCKCKNRFSTYEILAESLEIGEMTRKMKRNREKIKALWEYIGRYLEEVDS